eukprot:Skav223003  [mRNA]  locus=scaffold1827:553319:561893:- [translate_table: standard]
MIELGNKFGHVPAWELQRTKRQDFVHFVSDVAKEPTNLPILLARKMPSSTHYYLNFLVLQWVTHGMNLTRYVQAGHWGGAAAVTKFVGLSKIWSEDEARALAEPEDQDEHCPRRHG